MTVFPEAMPLDNQSLTTVPSVKTVAKPTGPAPVGPKNNIAALTDKAATDAYASSQWLTQQEPEYEKNASQITTSFTNNLNKYGGELNDNLTQLRQNTQPFKAPEQQDPTMIFGSKAGLLAGIASLFTRAPLTTSLNAMASGMKAINEGNATEYQRSFDQWKVNTDYAFKMADTENKAVDSMINLSKTNYDAAVSGLNAIFAARKDVVGQQVLAAQGLEGVEKIHLERQRLAQEAQKSYLDTQVPLQIYNKSIADFRTENHREPSATEMSNMLRMAKSASLLGALSPEQRESYAAQAATGMPMNQVISGFGKEAVAQRQQVHQDAVNFIMGQNPGMTAAQAGQELAVRTVNYGVGKRSIGQLGTMMGATKQAVLQLDYNIGKAKEEIAKLGSTNISPIINAIARGEEKWTGQPAYSGLFLYMHAVAAESAKILMGGQASVAQLHSGAAEEAQKWANANMTPASFEEVAGAMHGEGENRIDNYLQAIESQKSSFVNPGGAPSAPQSGGTDYSNLWGGHK